MSLVQLFKSSTGRRKTAEKCFSKAVQLQLRFNFVSTTVRLPFDCNTTALRPFDDLRYDRWAYLLWAAPEINKQLSVTTASAGFRHRDLKRSIGRRIEVVTTA